MKIATIASIVQLICASSVFGIGLGAPGGPNDGGPLDANGCHVSLRTNLFHCHPEWRQLGSSLLNKAPRGSQAMQKKKAPEADLAAGCMVIGDNAAMLYYLPGALEYAELISRQFVVEEVSCFSDESAARAAGYRRGR